LSFAVVIPAFVLMRPAELYRVPPAPREKGQIRQGLRYAWQARNLRVLIIIMVMMGILVFNTPVVLPVLTKLTFHADAGTYGLLALMSGAGALIGSLVVAKQDRLSPEQLLASGTAMGLTILAFSQAPSPVVLAPILVAMGVTQMIFLTGVTTTIQLDAEPVMRGRVMALFVVASTGTVPLGSLLVGWIMQHASPRWPLLGGGAGILVVLALSARSMLAHRGVAATPQPEPVAA